MRWRALLVQPTLKLKTPAISIAFHPALPFLITQSMSIIIFTDIASHRFRRKPP